MLSFPRVFAGGEQNLTPANTGNIAGQFLESILSSASRYLDGLHWHLWNNSPKGWQTDEFNKALTESQKDIGERKAMILARHGLRKLPPEIRNKIMEYVSAHNQETLETLALEEKEERIFKEIEDEAEKAQLLLSARERLEMQPLIDHWLQSSVGEDLSQDDLWKHFLG
jgi:hypothetical protein